jgi:hypothetical protein
MTIDPQCSQPLMQVGELAVLLGRFAAGDDRRRPGEFDAVRVAPRVVRDIGGEVGPARGHPAVDDHRDPVSAVLAA